MHLVMFDIDGTLTETMKVDEECFVCSLKNVFGFDDIDTDWSHYPRTTDSGIFHDVFTSRIGRSPTAEEISRFRQHFIQLLAAASSQSPFAPIAGADALLSRLAQDGSHRVSFATGSWRDSARLKMASAGMCFDDHPAASADDALDRESIMRLSQQRAAERYGASFASTVFVVTEFGMLAHVTVLACRLLVLARRVERHDCPRRALFVFSLISLTPIFF
jgi:beta-phosphoglucomutase-like phosphatase (HAD superfamily)